MANAGWNLELETWQNNHGGVAAKCRRGTNWFGWSAHADVGTVSATLQGNGEATLDFGNCWDKGEVKVYLNDWEVASAQENTPSKIVSFNFNDGDILKLIDGGGGRSMFVINAFKCRPTR